MNRLILCEGMDDFVFVREVVRDHFSLKDPGEAPYWKFDKDDYRVAKLVGSDREVIVATPKKGGKETLLEIMPGFVRMALADGPGRMGLALDPERQENDDLARSVADRLSSLDVAQSWRREGMIFHAEPASLDFRVVVIAVCNGSSEIHFQSNQRCLDQVLVKVVLESKPKLLTPLKNYVEALEALGVKSSPKVARAALMAAVDPATVSGFIGKVVGRSPSRETLVRTLEELNVLGGLRKVVQE